MKRIAALFAVMGALSAAAPAAAAVGSSTDTCAGIALLRLC